MDASEQNIRSSHYKESLFKIVMHYVVTNISNVHSFVGLPELIGEQIFDVVLKFRIFWDSSPENIAAAVQLFIEAYPERFRSLCLKDSLLAINNYTDAVKCLMSCATELDLSNCNLGNCHETLEHLSSCQRLEKLYLARNNLDDSGIRKMTLPMRMYKKGPLRLKILDLSENPGISSESIKWIVMFKELLVLDLSRTKVQRIELLKKHNFEAVSQYEKPVITTSTWSVEVVDNWNSICEFKIKQNAAKQLQKQSHTESFYGRKKSGSPVAEKVKPVPGSSQVYIRKLSNSQLQDSRICTTKGRTKAAVEEASLELLRSYQDTGPPPKKVKKALFDW